MSWGVQSGDKDYSSGEPGMDVPVSGLNISPYALDPSYLPQAPEFIFPVESRQKSWNEKMFNRIGTSYITGLGVGGVWGLYEGLSSPEGRGARLRANSIINGCTRRGPFLGNTLAVLALMYSPLESVIGHYRQVEDAGNSIAAATITGAVYRSTAGVRSMAIAGGVGCAIFGVYALGQYVTGHRTTGSLNYT